MPVYTPIFASPSDSSSITLCRILDVLASNSGSEQAPVVGSISTGTGTLVVSAADISTLSFSTAAATSGTISISASVDGTNYLPTSYVALTSGNTSSSFNAATITIGQINTVGVGYIKFTASSLVGTITITTVGANGVSNVMLDNPLPAGSNAIGYLSSPSGFTAGQQAVTASAAALPSASLTTGIVLTNGSSATVYIGGSSVTSSTGYALASGASIGLVVAQLSSVYIIGTASSGNLSYIGS
jgi:hypothetical protein